MWQSVQRVCLHFRVVKEVGGRDSVAQMGQSSSSGSGFGASTGLVEFSVFGVVVMG